MTTATVAEVEAAALEGKPVDWKALDEAKRREAAESELAVLEAQRAEAERNRAADEKALAMDASTAKLASSYLAGPHVEHERAWANLKDALAELFRTGEAVNQAVNEITAAASQAENVRHRADLAVRVNTTGAGGFNFRGSSVTTIEALEVSIPARLPDIIQAAKQEVLNNG